MRNSNQKLQSFITIGMLSSISFILTLFHFPIPPFPTFLEVDFGDMPALLAAITLGPIAGVIVEFIKNILNWLFLGAPTGVPIGHMANFTSGILFILPVVWLFNRFKHIKGLMFGLMIGTVSMAVGMSVLNIYVFLPMYTKFLGMEAVVGHNLTVMIVQGILPFNIVKGILLTIIMWIVYKAMQSWIDKQRSQYLQR